MCMRGKDLQLGFRTDPFFCTVNSTLRLRQMPASRLSLQLWLTRFAFVSHPFIKLKQRGQQHQERAEQAHVHQFVVAMEQVDKLSIVKSA